MGTRDIKDAHPRLQKSWAFVQAEWPKRYPDDLKPFLTEVYRSPDVQQALYAQGRRPIREVNSLRRSANLAPINENENRKTVTNAKPGQSKHQRKPAHAVDIWFARGKQLVDDTRLWNQLAVLMKEADPGIVWGGNFKAVDKPHFEI